MERDFLKDVTPPAHKRSIRDIPIPVSRKNTESVSTGNAINLKKIKIRSTDEREEVTSKPQPQPQVVTKGGEYYREFVAAQNQKPRSSRHITVPLTLIVIIGLVFGALNVFASATITVAAKKASVDVDQNIPVVDIALVENETQLPYRNIEFSKMVSEDITASGEEYVSKKSSGIITVYNNYTNKPQELLKNTRFQSTAGKIYRIEKIIAIPGYKMSGTKKIPGQIDVTVVADATGDSFDTGKTDFTIPGFKGQEQFTTIYASSKTDITGGFEGSRKIIADADLKATTDKLKSNLKSALVEEVKNQLPNNLVPIYDDSSFTIDPIQKKDVGDDKVNIQVSGKITVKVIDKHKLSQKIAEYAVSDYKVGEKVLVQEFSSLNITTSTGSVNVSGKADIVWQIDDSELKKAAAGTPKNQIQSTFASFVGVQKLESKFMPTWKSNFPENVDDINVVIN